MKSAMAIFKIVTPIELDDLAESWWVNNGDACISSLTARAFSQGNDLVVEVLELCKEMHTSLIWTKSRRLIDIPVCITGKIFSIICNMSEALHSCQPWRTTIVIRSGNEVLPKISLIRLKIGQTLPLGMLRHMPT